MITKVRIDVTEELLKRIMCIIKYHLYPSKPNYSFTKDIELGMSIDNMVLYIHEDKLVDVVYDKDAFIYKPIRAIDFINSFGEQEWLPEYQEQAEFSNDGKTWHMGIFNYYIPEVAYPFRTNMDNYKYVRRL